MQGIQVLVSHLTIILIAHLLNTIQEYDKIFEIKSGRIVAQGT